MKNFPKKIIALALLSAVSFPAAAAEQDRKPCYEIYPSRGATAPGSLLLDRCTGRTWMLEQDASAPAGGPSAKDGFRWVQLHGAGDEPDASPYAARLDGPMPTR